MKTELNEEMCDRTQTMEKAIKEIVKSSKTFSMSEITAKAAERNIPAKYVRLAVWNLVNSGEVLINDNFSFSFNYSKL